jgi:hypothetical protein
VLRIEAIDPKIAEHHGRIGRSAQAGLAKE